MIKEIKVYEDMIAFDDKYCCTDDSYKYGRFYEAITAEKAAEFITDKPTKIISVSDMQDKKAYIISECSHMNGWTTDFVVKINKHIYVSSYVKGGICGGLCTSICYNVDTHSFETDKHGDPLVSEIDDRIIDKACDF